MRLARTLWVIPPPLPKYKIKKYSLFLWIIPTRFAALFRLFMAANLLTIKYIEMRKILLCLGVVFGFVGSGFGQDFEWAKSMGGNSI